MKKSSLSTPKNFLTAKSVQKRQNLRRTFLKKIFCYNKHKDRMFQKGVLKNLKNKIRVAVCGNLPTACNYLLKNGIVLIDKFSDATEISDEQVYHLILVYAPQAEGLLNTRYTRSTLFNEEADSIPIRLLNEPCCESALIELKSVIRRIEKRLAESSTQIFSNITHNF